MKGVNFFFNKGDGVPLLNQKQRGNQASKPSPNDYNVLFTSFQGL
jgi:hypothetical protein